MAGSGLGIHIFGRSGEMTAFLVQRWLETAKEAIKRKGVFSAALSGGATPSGFYRGLAILKGDAVWDDTHIFPVDERFVPRADKDSNIGMMDSLFLKHVDLAAENVHPVMADAPSPSVAADLYEQELRRFFGLSGTELPQFDLICLGIGEDGHTASLFPGVPEAEAPMVFEKVRLAVSVVHGNVKHARISLTLPVISNARNVIFIVAGRNKAAIVKRVVGDRDQGFPASRVELTNGRLIFVLDSEAASMLD